jgi:hypothetical protein
MLKTLRAARKAHDIHMLKAIAKTCPHCGRYRAASRSDHEKHEKVCHRRKRRTNRRI